MVSCEESTEKLEKVMREEERRARRGEKRE